MDQYIVALGVYVISIAAIAVIGRKACDWYAERKQPTLPFESGGQQPEESGKEREYHAVR